MKLFGLFLFFVSMVMWVIAIDPHPPLLRFLVWVTSALACMFYGINCFRKSRLVALICILGVVFEAAFFVGPPVGRWFVFEKGHGDAGLYILKKAKDFGATLAATNGFPYVSDQWQYYENTNSVCVDISGDKFSVIQSMLHQALGKNAGGDGGEYEDYSLSTNYDGPHLHLYGGLNSSLFGSNAVTEVIIWSHRPPNLSLLTPVKTPESKQLVLAIQAASP